MFPNQQIEGFEKYWRARKPGSSTAVHYASDVRIFFYIGLKDDLLILYLSTISNDKRRTYKKGTIRCAYN